MIFRQKRLMRSSIIIRLGHVNQWNWKFDFNALMRILSSRTLEDFIKGNPKATISTSQSLSVMTDTTKSASGWYFDRKEITYKDGNQDTTAHNRKRREKMFKVFSGKDSELFRVALASEEEIPEFSSNIAHRIRFKIRCSVLIDKVWSYDFTTTVQLEKAQFANLKQTKERLFPAKKITPSNFLDHVKSLGDLNLTYEFEVEHIGKANDLTVDHIKKRSECLNKYHQSWF